MSDSFIIIYNWPEFVKRFFLFFCSPGGAAGEKKRRDFLVSDHLSPVPLLCRDGVMLFFSVRMILNKAIKRIEFCVFWIGKLCFIHGLVPLAVAVLCQAYGTVRAINSSTVMSRSGLSVKSKCQSVCVVKNPGRMAPAAGMLAAIHAVVRQLAMIRRRWGVVFRFIRIALPLTAAGQGDGANCHTRRRNRFYFIGYSLPFPCRP